VPEADNAAAVLTVSDVSVRFGGVVALDAVSLTVRPGTVTGLIGPNGAGKSTLFNVISGLQSPDSGTVHLFDADVTTMKPHHRARLGLARTFQRLEVFGTLSVGENVLVGLEAGGRWRGGGRPRRSPGPDAGADNAAAGELPAGESSHPRARSDAACARLLRTAGLAGLGGQQAATLTTGRARMVELARALAIGPKLLLLDEPGSGLDEVESATLGELVATLAREGMAVLLVEHDIDLVMRICDRVHVLDFGDIIASGTPEEIRRNPAVQSAYLGAVIETDQPDDRDTPPAPGGAR
jgi:branched-chain amino acid transport system ATP-binding protein